MSIVRTLMFTLLVISLWLVGSVEKVKGEPPSPTLTEIAGAGDMDRYPVTDREATYGMASRLDIEASVSFLLLSKDWRYALALCIKPRS